MRIATLLFTYNRSFHTGQVLNALRQNTEMPEKLFVFQDGVKQDKDLSEWKKVNDIINNIDWCDNEIIVSDYNKGLADSVISGIEYVFREYDAIIVLEDDCVPFYSFMTFMNESLQTYRDNKEVYSVSGYAYPIEIANNGWDAYFCRRASSWGWGTWKNRWAYYRQDYKILGRIKNDAELAEQLHFWGEDLEGQLLGNVYGKYNSWAVFWACTVIEQKGFCLSPYKSLIKNIGFDGTGVHCGDEEIGQCLYEENRRSHFELPLKIEFPLGCELEYSAFFSWTSLEERLASCNRELLNWISYLTSSKYKLSDKLIQNGIYRCSIWGKGKLCDLLLKEFYEKIEVLSVIESHPKENRYKDIPIVGINNIPSETQLIIVTPVYDFQKIKKMAEKSVKCEIKSLDEIFAL